MNSKMTTGAVEFGTTDAKGRALGVIWYVEVVGARPERVGQVAGRDADGMAAWVNAVIPALPAGFEIQVQPSRNGQWFGGSVARTRVTDLDAAFAEIARRASGTMKRYAKLAGKAVAS